MEHETYWPTVDIWYDNWEDFVTHVKPRDGIIFRGQSNEGIVPKKLNSEHEKWKIVSAFHRGKTFSFGSSQDKYEDAKELFKYYNIPSRLDLISSLEYLQHYGFPTPLVDFTKNPITALYFAVKDFDHDKIKDHNAYGNPADDTRYVTVFELDTNILRKEFNIKTKDELIHKKDYEIFDEPIFLVLNPDAKYNKNVKKQDGVFVYLNTETDLNDLLYYFLFDLIKKYHPLPIPFPAPITAHNIKYESIYHFDLLDKKPTRLYEFLYEQKKVGRYLFEGAQGLVLDIKNRELFRIIHKHVSSDNSDG